VSGVPRVVGDLADLEQRAVAPDPFLDRAVVDHIARSGLDNALARPEVVGHAVLRLKRSDVLFGWAGVRPLTYDPDQPMGARARQLHDLSVDGLPGAFALSARPIMTHRFAGVEALAAVRRLLEPSGPPGTISYAARLFQENQNSPRLLADGHDAILADLRYAAEHEHPRTLADLLFRRIGVAWTPRAKRARPPRWSPTSWAGTSHAWIRRWPVTAAFSGSSTPWPGPRASGLGPREHPGSM